MQPRAPVDVPQPSMSPSMRESVLEQEVVRLSHEVRSLSRGRDEAEERLRNERKHQHELLDSVRRDVLTDSVQQRKEAERAQYDATILAADCQTLKRELQQEQAKRAELEASVRNVRDRDLDSARRSADLSATVTSMRNQCFELTESNVTLRREKASLEILVQDLRKELQVTTRTIDQQTETIRQLTAEMARRDPYHQVKFNRDQGQGSQELLVKIEELNKQVAKANEERTAALEELRRIKVEAQVYNETKAQAQPAATAKLLSEATAAEAQNKTNFAITERDSALEKFKQAVADRDAALEKCKLAVADRDNALERLKTMQSAGLEGDNKNKALLTDAQRSQTAAEKRAAEAEAQATKYKNMLDAATLQKKDDIEKERRTYETAVADLQAKIKDSNQKAALEKAALEQKLSQNKEDALKARQQLADQMAALQLQADKLAADVKQLKQENSELTQKLIQAQKPATQTVMTSKGVALTTTAVSEAPPAASPAVEITLWVKSCADLMDRDGGGVYGTDDPFAIVYDPTGKEILRTPTITDNENPEWGLDKGSCKMALSPSSPGFVTVEVWNWNAVSNNFLGCIRIPVVDLFEHGPGDRKIQLREREKETDPFITENKDKLGSITVRVTIPGMEEKADAQVSRQAPEVCNEGTEVFLWVKSCQELINRDGFGKGVSDPFVDVFDPVGNRILRTPTVNENLNPEWSKDDGSVKLFLVPGSTGSLTFKVWDYNYVQNSFLGCMELPIIDIFKNKSGDFTYKLGKRDKENDEEILANEQKLGFITLQVRLPEGATARAVSPSNPTGGLAPTNPPEDVFFWVKSASDLINQDGFGSGVSDSFAIMYDMTGKEVLRTVTIDNNLSPTWPIDKASIKLPLTRGGPGVIKCELWDWNLTKNSFLGMVQLSMADVFAGAGARSFQLCPREKEVDPKILESAGKLGTLTIEIRYVGAQKPPAVVEPDALQPSRSIAAKGVQQAQTTVPPQQPSAQPPSTQPPSMQAPAGTQPAITRPETVAAPQPQMVSLWVKSASDLINQDGFGSGVSDSFAIMYDMTGKEVLRTVTIDNNLKPNMAD